MTDQQKSVFEEWFKTTNIGKAEKHIAMAAWEAGWGASEDQEEDRPSIGELLRKAHQPVNVERQEAPNLPGDTLATIPPVDAKKIVSSTFELRRRLIGDMAKSIRKIPEMSASEFAQLQEKINRRNWVSGEYDPIYQEGEASPMSRHISATGHNFFFVTYEEKMTFNTCSRCGEKFKG